MPREQRRPANEPAAALTRNALIPFSIALCFVLVYLVRVPSYWVVPVGGVFMVLYLWAPILGRRSLASFDRDLVQLLAGGRRSELRGRFRRALGMRVFAAPALVAARRGMIAAECGAPAAARDAYLDALEGWGEGEAPLAVHLGLAHASYALGEDDQAIRSYRAVLRESAGLPRVARNLVHALARNGRDLGEAERLAEQLVREAGEEPPREILLLRGLVHAKRGQRGPARKILERTSGARCGDPQCPDPLRDELESAISRRSA